MPTPPSPPAFIVGITGYMDIPERDRDVVRERLRAVFRWLREDPQKSLDDATTREAWWPTVEAGADGGEQLPLPGLGLGEHPIVLLSSLAPGADTIAAQVAREEGIEVRAPLPFPVEMFRESSSFCGDNVEAGAQATFDALIADPSAPIDTFPVLLASDLDLNAAQRPERFAADLGDKERRHLRYRASGEFIATYSHLTLALYDSADDVAENLEAGAGTGTIVDVRRSGPTTGILPTNHFPWTDSGAVFHVPTRSVKRLPSPDDIASDGWQSTPARFLPPYSTPGGEAKRGAPPSPEAIATSYSELRETARLLGEYGNETQTIAAPSEAKAIGTLIDLPSLRKAGLTEAGAGFLQKLAPMAQARTVGAALAQRCDAARRTMMRSMALFAFLAALSFHCSSHWHFAHKGGHGGDDHHPAAHTVKELENMQGSIGLMFLAVSVLLLLHIILRYRRYAHTSKEWLRFDARAIAEGLRIQFYWAAAGISASVAARYMHRQKGQLNWIRNAISSLSFPYERWRDGFEALPAGDRKLIMGEVVRSWPRDQWKFFGRAVPKANALLHRFHILGWALTLGGLIQAILIFVWKAFFHSVVTPYFIWVSALAIAAAIICAFVSRGSSHAADAEHDGYTEPRPLLRFLDKLLGGGRPPVTLSVIGAITGLVAVVPHLAYWTPGAKDIWIILTGASLVGGAILIAWSEKLSLAEHSRQYDSMNHLFGNACTRADDLLERWQPEEAGTPAPDTIGEFAAGSELRRLLVDLGKEALDENAEWLLLHRSRPLEPFLAG